MTAAGAGPRRRAPAARTGAGEEPATAGDGRSTMSRFEEV
jgi:hypothetical protein